MFFFGLGSRKFFHGFVFLLMFLSGLQGVILMVLSGVKAVFVLFLMFCSGLKVVILIILIILIIWIIIEFLDILGFVFFLCFCLCLKHPPTENPPNSSHGHLTRSSCIQTAPHAPIKPTSQPIPCIMSLAMLYNAVCRCV